jgi:hypothetical protein
MVRTIAALDPFSTLNDSITLSAYWTGMILDERRGRPRFETNATGSPRLSPFPCTGRSSIRAKCPRLSPFLLEKPPHRALPTSGEPSYRPSALTISRSRPPAVWTSPLRGISGQHVYTIGFPPKQRRGLRPEIVGTREHVGSVPVVHQLLNCLLHFHLPASMPSLLECQPRLPLCTLV